MERERVQAELALLRALENLCVEHQVVIQREKDAMEDERKRMSAWIHDIRDSCDKERVGALLKEKEARVPVVGGATDRMHRLRRVHLSTQVPVTLPLILVVGMGMELKVAE